MGQAHAGADTVAREPPEGPHPEQSVNGCSNAPSPPRTRTGEASSLGHGCLLQTAPAPFLRGGRELATGQEATSQPRALGGEEWKRTLRTPLQGLPGAAVCRPRRGGQESLPLGQSPRNPLTSLWKMSSVTRSRPNPRVPTRVPARLLSPLRRLLYCRGTRAP